MPKATTKSGLLDAAEQSWAKMQGLIDSLSICQRQQDFCFDIQALTAKDQAAHWTRDANLRDVLAHLYEWHRLLIDWVAEARGGQPRPFLPAPYTWSTYQQMNEMFCQKHRDTSYDDAVQMLDASHREVMALMQEFDEQELFVKKHFSWTGTTSLGQYFHSATVAHYDWATKKLKAYHKALATQ